MALPAPLETVTVRGLWLSPSAGTPLAGSATLRAINEVRSSAGNVLISLGPERRTLVAGAAEWLQMLYSDSTGLSGTVYYQIEVTGSGHHEKRYIELRKADAVDGVIQLADVVTLEAPPVLVPSGGGAVASVDGRTGVVTLGDLYTDAAELAAGLATKASTSHTHTASQVTDFTTAVDARVQLIVDAAPVALDTLNELAAALGDDANFAATVTTTLAGKAPLASPAFSGTPTGIAKAHVGLANVDNTSDVAKPVSTATQTALDGKAAVAHKHPYDRLLDAYSFVGVSGDPAYFGATATPGSSDHLIGLVPAQAGVLVGAVSVASQQAGTYSANATPAQVKVYDWDGVLLGSSADDPTLWLAAGWHLATLTTPITVPANGLVFVGLSFGGFTGAGPAIQPGNQHSNVVAGLAGGRRRSIYGSSGSGLPSSFSPVSYGLSTTWYPLVGLVAG